MAQDYPPVAFSFAVSIQGSSGVDASFSEVSGLTVERTVMEIKEGGRNTAPHRVPDRGRMGNLVLKRGVVLGGSGLFDWCKRSLEGDLGQPMQVKTIAVSLVNADGKPTLRWTVNRAWPVKWALSSFNAMESNVAVETLEFAFSDVAQERSTG